MLVAKIMMGKEILEHEIMDEQIQKADQRSKGALSYPTTITYLCIEAGCTYIQGIYQYMQSKPLISLTHDREYTPREDKRMDNISQDAMK